MRRILVVALTVLGAGLLPATPASAGNWEETLLDPPPARIEAGVTYTFGYWVLQHGSYPYQGGDLGPTALRASDGKGTIIDFTGVATATAGHYSAEVLFPHDGEWSIGSQHEVLMPDPLVATVTVPGAARIEPSSTQSRAPYEWGAVHPSFPPPGPDAATGAVPGAAPPAVTRPSETAQDVAPRSNAVAEPPGTDLPVWLVLAGGLATIALAVFLARRHRRTN
ncbi:hypothetical protein [Actinophytocola oryzae]|uniref:Uncharacterized protein n=1 Tax=Actinophytocola oryzae TaxID=502181 RepID=A0A4R7V2T0_9PSEU|nr:hypothetical protein [Actinophytocola oryzae]TDV43619.1 hypothetical protein CLV71_11581 [Actinophytocola oryzae]